MNPSEQAKAYAVELDLPKALNLTDEGRELVTAYLELAYLKGYSVGIHSSRGPK